MERDEKALWNRKYSEGSHSSLEPDPFLVRAYSEFLAGCQPSDALDVAGGVGRHALWLAEKGWKVKLIDISDVGIERARTNFAPHLDNPITKLPDPSGPSQPVVDQLHPRGTIRTEVRDLQTCVDLGQDQYDLIIVFFYLQRSLFPALISALRPGGFLIYKTYTVEQQRFSGGPSRPMHLLEPDELRRTFASLQTLFYQETTSEKAVAELAARKR